jgi:hypothetical protein
MENSGKETRVCVACNEDGFGPSAFAYYIVRDLIESWTRIGRAELRVTVLNRSAATFNQKIYEGGPVKPELIDSLVRLPKPNGEVHVPQALDLLRPYAPTRASYTGRVRQVLEGCTIAIDIGVPLFTHAAAQFGVPHRLTVFDHSWAATLRLITSDDWKDIYRENPKPGLAERLLAERIARQIEEDEALATDVFLFENYITPGEFVSHWKNLGFTPRILPGVLGTRVSLDDAFAKLDSTLALYNEQGPAPRDRPLVLLSPGGTPVWDAQLPKLLDQVLAAAQHNYVLIVSKDLAELLTGSAGLKLLHRILDSDRIRYYGPVRGATQQAILPAFRRIVTRAGGGTVNDAIAAGVEVVFVEEPQVQIKLIERECAWLGISGPPATLEEFRRDPLECINRLVEMPLPIPQVAPALHAERTVVEKILSLAQ